MIRMNLREGDRIQIGEAVLSFDGKFGRVSRFTVDHAGDIRRHTIPAWSRVNVLPSVYFIVEKDIGRGGRRARISLQAPETVPVKRLSTSPPASMFAGGCISRNAIR